MYALINRVICECYTKPNYLIGLTSRTFSYITELQPASTYVVVFYHQVCVDLMIRLFMYVIAGKRLLLSCADIPQCEQRDSNPHLLQPCVTELNRYILVLPIRLYQLSYVHIMIDIPTYRIFTYTVAFSEACVTLLLMDEQ